MLDLIDTLGVKVISMNWNDNDNIPYYLTEIYSFQKVNLGGKLCIFATPIDETPPVQAITKHFKTIYSTSMFPVVLYKNILSSKRRKDLITAQIPFVAVGQVFLPFMGVILQEHLYNEPSSREKLMPSAQLVLLSYLYQRNKKMLTSGLAKKINVSAMQISRAVQQLQRLNLFKVSKDGVQIVIESATNHRTLFLGAEKYLLDPIHDIVFISNNDLNMPLAGLSALSEISMLAAPSTPTYAYYNKTEKLFGEKGLSDNEKQVCVEIWKYSPTILSENKNAADPLSVIISLRDKRGDERVEQAIEDFLNTLWRH